MKLTIAKEQLLHGLQSVQNIVTSRTTLPILSNVLLNAKDDRLVVTATDLDVTISCTVDAKVGKAGAVTLPARRLLEITREFPSLEIELEMEKGACHLTGGASYYKIHSLPAEDFPPIPAFEEKHRIVAPQEKLKSMLSRTAFAVSTDETRYVLNGIFLSLKDHKITMVATDGRRLALVEEETEIPDGSEADLIVPSKAINELTRLLKDKGDLEIKFTDNQVSFLLVGERGFDTLMISKRVEGNYPNYRQVIPTSSTERITLDREQFLGALRRAEIMTSDKANSVKLAFTQNTLTITSNTPEIGEAREVVTINYQGKDVAIAFNPAFLMDPLKVLSEPEVFFELTDELSPGVIKINGPFLYVIMPMRMS